MRKEKSNGVFVNIDLVDWNMVEIVFKLLEWIINWFINCIDFLCWFLLLCWVWIKIDGNIFVEYWLRFKLVYVNRRLNVFIISFGFCFNILIVLGKIVFLKLLCVNCLSSGWKVLFKILGGFLFVELKISFKYDCKN